MKKLDFLILFGVLLFISILFLIANNRKYDINNDIQIIINNEIIDNLSINDNNTYLINSDDLYIYVYKNGSLIKTIDNKHKKNIFNIITIDSSKIKMKESNCLGKDCMHMEINENHKLPIICTNGIVIKISNNDNKSDILIK